MCAFDPSLCSSRLRARVCVCGGGGAGADPGFGERGGQIYLGGVRFPIFT